MNELGTSKLPQIVIIVWLDRGLMCKYKSRGIV